MNRVHSKLWSIIIVTAMVLLLPMWQLDASADLRTDTSAPVVTKIEAQSQTVRPGDSFEIMVYAEDETGIVLDDTCVVNLESQSAHIEHSAPLEEVSEGVFRAVFHVDDSWVSQVYKVRDVVLVDEYGVSNYGAIDDSSDAEFTVITEKTDITAPVVTKVETKYGTYKPGDVIEIRFYAFDEDSGIDDADSGEVYLYRDVKSESATYSTEVAYPITLETDGVYKASIPVGENWVSTQYRISSFDIKDNCGNKTRDAEEDYEGSFTVVTENTDNIAPTVTDIVRTQDELRLGDTFQVIVSATDNVQIAENDSRNTVVIDSVEYECWHESPLVKASDDTYIATFTVDDTWIKGEYCIWNVSLYDVNGNSILVSTILSNDAEKYDLSGITVTDEPLPEEEDEPEETEEPSPSPSVSPTPSTAPSPSPSPSPTVSPSPSETVAPEPTPDDTDINEDDTPQDNTDPEEVVIEEPTVFVDVPEEKYYTSAVSYVAEQGYMKGTGDGQFSPNEKVTRGMIVHILYAQSGKPDVTASSSFRDLKEDKWYTDAVNWATENELVSGYTDGTFKADTVITRQQMVAILYKYAQLNGYDTTVRGDLSEFSDAEEISSYAVDAMRWAVGNHLISGTGKGLDPKGTATRGQIAVILQAFDENVKAS